MCDTMSASLLSGERDLALWRLSGLASVLTDFFGCGLRGEEQTVVSSHEMPPGG